MGLFKKLQGAAGAAPTDPEAVMAQQRALGIDTADYGGPSNAAVAPDAAPAAHRVPCAARRTGSVTRLFCASVA